MKIIDYLYYWFYHYYKKKCKIGNDEMKLFHKSIHFSASIALSALLFLLLFSFFLILGSLVPCVFSLNKPLVVFFFLGFCILIVLLVKRNDKNKIEILNEKFKSNTLNNKIKGWMMFLFMYSLFLLPILFSLVLRLLKL